MKWYYILIIIVSVFILLSIVMAYISYRLTFYSDKKNKKNPLTLPDQDIFITFKDEIKRDIEDIQKMTYKVFSIMSHDGLKLFAKYYEYKPGAPIEIMFHGYKGNGIRDMSTGVKRAHRCGRSALVVDQRASGESEGHIITFGIKERYDCIAWVNKAIEEFGEDVKLIIGGVSMGASTVLMASSFDLPKNVVGILADCGFNKPSDIIKKVVKDMKLPVWLIYPYIKLGARLFGHFNLEEASPYESVQKAKVPIIFFHGDKDGFVPYEMSKKLFDVTKSKKKLVTIKNAPHGVSYLVDPDYYVEELNKFFINEEL